MTRYPSDRLHEEVAYLSYHFHWPAEQSCGWTTVSDSAGSVVARINGRLNEERAVRR